MPQDSEEDQAYGLTEKDWSLLVSRIKDGACTPIIGPGACSEYYPSKSEIAGKWVSSEDYPFADPGNLARVAQFLVLDYDEKEPNDRLIKLFEELSCQDRPIQPFEKFCRPDFKKPDEPHMVLARLKLPLYITTNYDNFMVDAIRECQNDPNQDHCRWKEEIEPSRLDSSYRPNRANPLVFHLYGHIGNRDSLVLTERDYMEFLINVSKNEDLISGIIQKAISTTSLIFLGYHLDDWDFQILYHMIVKYLERNSRKSFMSVQLVPLGEQASAKQRERAGKLFAYYFSNRRVNVRVFWGTCQEFVTVLKEHMGV
jgi:hypothetical protein